MKARSSARRLEERAARVLAALAPAGRRLEPRPGPQAGRFELTLPGSSAPLLVVEPPLAEAMLARDWLLRDGDRLAAGAAGLAWLRRFRAGDEPWRGQHLDTEPVDIEAPDGTRARVEAVLNESPLAWLRRRRGADGRPLVSDVQFAAGERLRADFERARLQPRLSVDWTRPALDRSRRGPSGAAADLADSALAARRRIEAAMAALGPDLGGLLVDVCCFLIGIEDAERRRHWPRRSAKVVLLIALDRLAAHYGLSGEARGPASSGRVHHWGGEGYRPRLDADPVS